MEKSYRKLNNPEPPKAIFYLRDQQHFNYKPPQEGDIVSVTTKGKIYIQILVESIIKETIRGEIVGIGPSAAPITGTIDQDGWELSDKIEIEHSWIDGITYHQAK